MRPSSLFLTVWLQRLALSATLALPMGYVYLCIPLSGALIVFYELLILARPAQFKVADEVEVALEHIAEEERKLAAEGIILDAEKATGSKEKQA